MQAYILLGPIPIYGSASGIGFSSIIFDSHPWSWFLQRNRTSRSRCPRWNPVLINSSSSSSSSSASIYGEQNHYAILGLSRTASSKDIKKAYRVLARKYHPDVSKSSQAAEVFKSIRRAYEVLSNEVTRIQYDRALKYQEETGRRYNRKWDNCSEAEDSARIYRWAELRQKMERERYWEDYKVNDETSSYVESDEEADGENYSDEERGSFGEVLRSVFLSLFLSQTLGSRLSLTFSSLMALLDRKLDAGYKIGYVIAWVLGGRGGVLLSLCLSFASWVCGKTSSSIVALVVVAMWVGSNLARYAPFPQGAVLTLLYMSIKLQADLN